MLAPAPAADRLLPRLAPLCAAMFLGFLTVSLPLPALPLYVTGTLGFGTAGAGLTVGVQSLATLLTRAHAGRSVDADGPKATLVRGLLVCSGAGWLYLLSLAATSPAASLAVLLAGRATLGVGESLLITGVVSWGMSRAGPGRAGAAMSWNGMAQYGSLAVGAPVGFALFAAAGFAAVSVATALLPLAALGVVLPLEPVPAVGRHAPAPGQRARPHLGARARADAQRHRLRGGVDLRVAGLRGPPLERRRLRAAGLRRLLRPRAQHRGRLARPFRWGRGRGGLARHRGRGPDGPVVGARGRRPPSSGLP